MCPNPEKDKKNKKNILSFISILRSEIEHPTSCLLDIVGYRCFYLNALFLGLYVNKRADKEGSFFHRLPNSKGIIQGKPLARKYKK